MNSIEFWEKCRLYNIKYRELFGYVPCKDDYIGSQEDFYNVLIKAIDSKKDISEYIKKREQYEYYYFK